MKATKCPRCGSMSVVPIRYGLPAYRPPDWDEGKEEYVLGGCCVDDDSPTHACVACKYVYIKATYKQIMDYVQNHYGFRPKPCWVAHVKDQHNLISEIKHDPRAGRVHPCPPSRRMPIEACLRHFGMIVGSGVE